MPDVMASYYINADQDDYSRFGTNKMTGAERAWFVQHADDLVDTMANDSAPDVVGWCGRTPRMASRATTAAARSSSRTSRWCSTARASGLKDSNREMRLVDVMPTVLKAMGISYDPNSLDGEAMKLSKPKG